MNKYNKFFEMSNISTQKTGLDYIVWLSPKSGREKHYARIKIKVNDRFLSITISDNPEIKSNVKLDSKKLNKIYAWIKLNQETLLKYWNSEGNMGIDEVLKELKKVK